MVIRDRGPGIRRKVLSAGLSRVGNFALLRSAEARLLPQIQGRIGANTFDVAGRLLGARTRKSAPTTRVAPLGGGYAADDRRRAPAAAPASHRTNATAPDDPIALVAAVQTPAKHPPRRDCAAGAGAAAPAGPVPHAAPGAEKPAP